MEDVTVFTPTWLFVVASVIGLIGWVFALRMVYVCMGYRSSLSSWKYIADKAKKDLELEKECTKAMTETHSKERERLREAAAMLSNSLNEKSEKLAESKAEVATLRKGITEMAKFFHSTFPSKATAKEVSGDPDKYPAVNPDLYM